MKLSWSWYVLLTMLAMLVCVALDYTNLLICNGFFLVAGTIERHAK